MEKIIGGTVIEKNTQEVSLLTNLWTRACCPQQCSSNSFPFHSSFYFPEESKLSIDISGCYHVLLKGRNPAQQTVTVAQSCRSSSKGWLLRCVLLSWTTHLSFHFRVGGWGKKKLKGRAGPVIVPVGNCPWMWLEGLLKRPPIPTFPVLPATTDPLGLKSRSQAMSLAEPLQIPSGFEISGIK